MPRRTVYTTAPEAYDYATVVASEVVGQSGRHTFRRVTLEGSEYLIDCQLGRYASGMHTAVRWAIREMRDGDGA